MLLRMLLRILEHSYRPLNILFPFPVIPAIVGIFSGGFQSVWKPLVLTFSIYPAINLWNHVNDAEDDFKAGKDTPFLDDDVRKITFGIVAILYFFSGMLSYFFGGILCFGFFLIVFLATFFYSDNILFKWRLKRHYLWEVAVYLVSIPSFILMLYTSVSNIDENGVSLTLLFMPLLMSTVFVKDLKDISADREAGLKTLGTVFAPEVLIKLFSFSILTYFVLLILLFRNTPHIIAVFPIIGTLAGFVGFFSNGWVVSKGTIKYYTMQLYSALLSVLILFTSVTHYSTS